jgi:microcystin degradation protein MlrC
MRKIPMLITSSVGCTMHGPAKKAMDHFAEYCKEHHLIDCTFVHGFSSTDRPCSSASVLVTANGYCPQKEADELAAYIWQMRYEFLPESLSASEAIEKALSLRKEGYVVINESSDNPGSGCPGDGTHLLREFLRQDLPKTIMGPIYDPEAAKYLHSFREGDKVNVTIGGKTEPVAGEPLVLEDVKILRLRDLIFTSHSPMNEGLQINYGLSALLKKGNVEFMVVSQRMQVYDDSSYRAMGAELKDYHLVGLKSMNHFRSFFVNHADAIVAADTPGLRPANLKMLPYQHILRPIFPLDDGTEFKIDGTEGANIP